MHSLVWTSHRNWRWESHSSQGGGSLWDCPGSSLIPGSEDGQGGWPSSSANLCFLNRGSERPGITADISFLWWNQQELVWKKLMGKAKGRSPFSQEKAMCQRGKFCCLCLSLNRNSTLWSTLLPFLGHIGLFQHQRQRKHALTLPATDRTWKQPSCPCCSEKGKAGIQRDPP